jgi:protein-tyrosine phosphatase
MKDRSDQKKKKKTHKGSNPWKKRRKKKNAKLKDEHKIALCGELALEEAMDLSSDRLRNE